MAIKINTKPYGEVEIEENQILDFPDGLLGFDFVKKFVLLDSHDPTSPFKWLQAYEESQLAFVIIRPHDFMEEYKLFVPNADIEAVKASSIDELLVFAIVTIPSNPSEMTANLQGPVIINPKNGVGRQAISLNDDYSVRHRILDEIETEKETG